MVIKFKNFILEEVRLEDVLKSKNDYINSFVSNNFNSSAELSKFINLKIDGVLNDFRLLYNNNKNHDLIKRIKERTSLKSTEEFNTLIKKGLKELFEYNEIDKKSYALFYEEYNFVVIIELKIIDKYIKIATILPGSSESNTEKKIFIKSVL